MTNQTAAQIADYAFQATHNAHHAAQRAQKLTLDALTAANAIAKAVERALNAAGRAAQAAHSQMLRMQDAYGPSSPEAIAAEAIYDAAAEARAVLEEVA